MSRCTSLDDGTHDLLQAVSDRGVTKRGFARTTPDNLAEALDLPHQEARMLLADLEADGYLETTEYGQIRVLQGCSCRNLPSALDTERGVHAKTRAPARTRARKLLVEESGPPLRGEPSTSTRSYPEGVSPYTSSNTPQTPAPGRVAGKRVVRRARSAPTTPNDLASYWSTSLNRMKREFGLTWVGGAGHEQVRAQIARWLRDGEVTPELVRAMVDEFCRSPAWIRKGTPAWRTFLGNRQALANRAIDVARAEEPCDSREAWLGFEAPAQMSKAEWESW